MKKNSVLLNLLLIIEAVFILLNFYFVGGMKSSFLVDKLVLPWLLLLYLLIAHIFDPHTFYSQSRVSIIINAFVAQILFMIILLFFKLIHMNFLPNSFVSTVFCLVVGTFVSGLFHLILHLYYKKKMKQRRLVLVGQKSDILVALQNISHSGVVFDNIRYIILSDYLNNLKKLITKIDGVYIVGNMDYRQYCDIYRYLSENDKSIFISATAENSIAVNAQIINISDESILLTSPYALSFGQTIAKRSFDFVISTLLLFASLPIFITTALAIKLESSGKIFYKQERITLDNKPFTILKFRSMVDDAEAISGPILAMSDDRRVTKIGKFIRLTRIDELPQLINVMKGDMSLVGPRPERPVFVEQFKKENPYYSLRHRVRAGITGYAQVYGKYATSFDDKLKFDLLYLKNYSIVLDIKLLLKTITIIFDKVSSRGKEEDNVTSENLDELLSNFELLD